MMAHLIPLLAARERVADALIKTARTISQAYKAREPLQSSKITKSHTQPVTDINKFDKTAIQNTIYDMVIDEVYVSLTSLLKQKNIFHH
ncbi:hypothetical protein FQR65_LT07721 [Abscondita terminalis]|nr:hypothetical protein FQR65_LT07721 [Abscondita terminalis]